MAERAQFYSSVVPQTQGSHGQGLWPGIVVEAGGLLHLTDSVVANASAGVLVRGELVGDGITVNDAYRGVSVVGGSANITALEANRIDYEAVYVETGALNLTNGDAHEVAVGLANHAEAHVEDLGVSEAGVGVQALDGSLNLTNPPSQTPAWALPRFQAPCPPLPRSQVQACRCALTQGMQTDFHLHTAICKVNV